MWAGLCFVMQIMELGVGRQRRIVRAAFKMCFPGTLGGDWAVGREVSQVTRKLLEPSGREMGGQQRKPLPRPRMVFQTFCSVLFN